MLIFKMLSHLTIALLAFAIGTGIVAGFEYFAERLFSISRPEPSVAKSLSGIYFVSPSVDLNRNGCNTSSGEVYPTGWESFLETHQFPQIKRMARDGRWFFFETKTDDGRSYEFFGIIPDSVETVKGNQKVAVFGKLISLTSGEITGNVDASYLAPAGTFQ